MKISTAILTISTRCSAGESEDVSGRVIRELAEEAGWRIADYRVLSDDQSAIADVLQFMSDGAGIDLIITTGGTGISGSDVTPEATMQVIERRLPGFEEAMRMTGFAKTPYAIISRSVVGTRARTLIINLPGNPKAVQDGLAVLMPVIPHAVKVLQNKQVADAEHVFAEKE